MRLDLGAGRILPRWVVAFFLGGAVVLIPWIVLMFTVPEAVDVPRHWELVWGGFDCFLVLGFAVTAFRLMTRSPRGAVTAAMTGTMLLIDAWFDVLTTHRGGQLLSILMAVFAEIPCAVICFYVSRRIVSLFEQAKTYLEAGGFTVRAGRLVPPLGFPHPAQGAHGTPAEVLLGGAKEPGPAAAAGVPAAATGPDPFVASAVASFAAGPFVATSAAPLAPAASERGLAAPVGQQGLLAEQL